MSTRTIIEINHDYLHDLLEHPDEMRDFLTALKGTIADAITPPSGIKVLGERHHSETLKLTVR
jgi:hypothetical protein